MNGTPQGPQKAVVGTVLPLATGLISVYVMLATTGVFDAEETIALITTAVASGVTGLAVYLKSNKK